MWLTIDQSTVPCHPWLIQLLQSRCELSLAIHDLFIAQCHIFFFFWVLVLAFPLLLLSFLPSFLSYFDHYSFPFLFLPFFCLVLLFFFSSFCLSSVSFTRLKAPCRVLGSKHRVVYWAQSTVSFTGLKAPCRLLGSKHRLTSLLSSVCFVSVFVSVFFPLLSIFFLLSLFVRLVPCRLLCHGRHLFLSTNVHRGRYVHKMLMWRLIWTPSPTTFCIPCA